MILYIDPAATSFWRCAATDGWETPGTEVGTDMCIAVRIEISVEIGNDTIYRP